MVDGGDLRDAAEGAKNSRPMGWVARAGLAARGVVYIIMGLLAVLVGLGAKAHIDQRGALTEVLAQPFGTFLVVLLAVGFACYALWRISEAILGVTGEADGAGPRLKSLARGLPYAALSWTAVALLRGARGTQAGKQSNLAGDVLAQPAGRWALGLVGLAVVAVGVMRVREGWSDRFLRHFGHLPAGSQKSVIWLGRVGTVARGVVFVIVGWLVVLAAVNADPENAGGVDVAFKSLLDEPFGLALVLLLGAGLIVFGVYGLAEAAWLRVTEDEPT